jgi:hypothetical protein
MRAIESSPDALPIFSISGLGRKSEGRGATAMLVCSTSEGDRCMRAVSASPSPMLFFMQHDQESA